MALYRITNLKNGTVILPSPLNRRLNKGGEVTVSGPAGLLEQNSSSNKQYSALVDMSRNRLISIRTVNDPTVDPNVEVATVSMLSSGGSGSSEYLAVADNAARDAISVADRVEGMLVRTNDSGLFWLLGSDLVTWTLWTTTIDKRQLISEILSGGPSAGYTSGAYREILPAGNPFPTSVIWWVDASKTQKIIEIAITYAGTVVTLEVYSAYDDDGVTVSPGYTFTDTITNSGPFEVSRTRVIT